MNFSKPYLTKAVEDLNFIDFTDIQKAVLPNALAGKDIIATSQTGTGKTHAYLIPIFEHLDETRDDIQAVIMSPTRELATQIADFARHIAGFSEKPIKIALYTGGKDRDKELAVLAKGQPHIVVGTPGKIHDLAIKENALKVYRAQTLVIDEADMALEIGFLEDIDQIARTMGKHLQMMVFSATIPERLRPFLKKYMNNPKEISIIDKSLKTLNLTHTFIKCTPQRTKDHRLKETIGTINPYLAIIFANKKEDVDRLSKDLYQAGKNVVALHGDMPQRKRKQILRDINRLTYQYIVASDMASRGLDLEGVSHIINYDLPKDMAFFVHRIGRSGRMGASGETISFFTDKDTHAFEFIEKQGITITVHGGQRPPLGKSSKKRG